MNGVLEALKRLLDAVGGAGDDLTREDVIARCVEAVLELSSFGGRRDVFPARTEIVVSVPPNLVEIARGYVADPAFDREVAGRVKNELANPGALPVRIYRVEEGARFAAVATAAAARCLALRWGVESWPLPPGKPEILVGRGPWHGSDELRSNDVVLPDLKAISRSAVRLHPVGDGFEVEASGQDRDVSVVGKDGGRRRPAFSATGRIVMEVGDALEFSDGKQAVLSAILVDAERDGTSGG